MMLNLASGIIDQGVQVDMVLVRGEGALFSAIPDDVRLIHLGNRRTMRSIPALAGYLRRERPLALLSALTHVNVAAVLANRLSGCPTRVIVSERSTISQERAEISAVSVRAAYRLVPWVYPWADGIITVSMKTAEDLSHNAGIPLERISVINNPVVSADITMRASELVHHPWFEPNQPPVILGVGRLSPEKEFQTLIRAFDEVRRHRPARLMVLGEGKERQSLEALTRDLALEQHVELPGFVENPLSFMARSAVLALTSRWEGSPNVLIEAMVCGTPVVSTDCPNGPHEILDGGRLGRLVPVSDSAQLADAILQTLADPVASELLHQRANEFTVESSAKNYLRVLLDGN